MNSAEINALPLCAYEGPIELVRTPSDLQKVLESLQSENLLGFDIETRPSFRRGESHPPAVLQLAGASTVWVFQLRHLHLPEPLLLLLSNPTIIKAGVAPLRDITDLKRMADFRENGFVDVADMAARWGIKNQGLRGLAAVLLGFRVSKQARVTNWARDVLTPTQLRYAATDAWVSRRLYQALDG